MLRFATTNSGKLEEAREYLANLVGPIEQFDYDYVEIQSTNLAEIATYGARQAFEAVGEPVIVDDSGLFIDVFDGFPGPYSSFVDQTIGYERVADLTLEEENHNAKFRTVIAFFDGNYQQTFEGAVKGKIVNPRGDGGFGYDPIFEHNGTTFAEMDREQKNALSHRGRALAKLADWIDEEHLFK